MQVSLEGNQIAVIVKKYGIDGVMVITDAEFMEVDGEVAWEHNPAAHTLTFRYVPAPMELDAIDEDDDEEDVIFVLAPAPIELGPVTIQ